MRRAAFLIALTLVLALFLIGCPTPDKHHGATGDHHLVAGDDAGDDDSGPGLPRWLLDRPYLQDRSLFAEEIDHAATPDVRELGPVGIGNGLVFGLVGNNYPLAAWHNLGGPTYQKDVKWFSDKVPTLRVGDAPRAPARESIGYVRRAPVAIVAATDGELEWTTVNFAPRGTDRPEAEQALVSVWIVRNLSAKTFDDVGLTIAGTMAKFGAGRLQEDDLAGHYLHLRPLGVDALPGPSKGEIRVPFGSLAPGQERVVVVPIAFIDGPLSPDPVFRALSETGIDALLESTMAWWQAWSAGNARLDAPDAKWGDLLDALALSVKVNQAASGGLTEMSQYSYVWLRDTHGPSLFYPLIGRADDYKAMLDYLYGVSVLAGDIGNALAVDADVSDLPPPPDWRNLGTFTGRTRAEAPSFLVLEYENYYKATGDLDTLAARYDMLWHAIWGQQVVEGCVQYFSGDETFEDTMEATFGENVLGEPDESILSSYSSFAMIRAATFLAGIADALGKADDAAALRQRAVDFKACLDQVFWMPAAGFYAVQAQTATGEPYPTPYEDVDTMPLWLDLLAPDDPKAVANFESILALLGHDDGTLYSNVSPMYGALFGVRTGVQTGMSHGYWQVNLDKMFHPAADLAFRRLPDMLTPLGFADEALIVDDYSHLQILREGLGIVCDISARYRSWEAAILGHALLHYLTGYDYDVVAGTAKLAPHLPPDWDHATLSGLQYGTGRFDLDVRKSGASGRRITLTTGAGAEFVLSLAVPIDGPFSGATIGGEPAPATGAANRYGRTVVRFPPLAIRAGAKTEIVVRSEQKVK